MLPESLLHTASISLHNAAVLHYSSSTTILYYGCLSDISGVLLNMLPAQYISGLEPQSLLSQNLQINIKMRHSEGKLKQNGHPV